MWCHPTKLDKSMLEIMLHCRLLLLVGENSVTLKRPRNHSASSADLFQPQKELLNFPFLW